MPLDNPVGSPLEALLRRETQGEALFDAFSRVRYATDASIYQIEPLSVVVPKSCEDAAAAIAIHTAREWLSPAPVAEAVTDIGHDAPFVRISGQIEVGPNLDRPWFRPRKAIAYRGWL